MFNLKKAKAEQNHSERLDGSLERKKSLENKTIGNGDWLLKDVRVDKSTTTTTEDQLEASRQGFVTEGRLTEGQLEHHKSPDGAVPTRATNVDGHQMPPLAALNATQEAEHVRAYNEASLPRDDTSFWDKYIGVQLENGLGKQPNAVPESGSQLQNQYDRLKSVKVDDLGKVKEMVMASLKDADAMLFFIYHKAAQEGRSLTAEETALVNGITNDKVKLAKLL
jgi:hypothetical protein